ncbi:MAG: hypothetical protein K0S47_4503 [Herbinix sp.]|jgi:uncharacterized protein with ParB-like and HNH nuclease domain|nr:hypothetical protein [Herbinix sp.]MDF2845320.1 hypothetical protein [Herbinix sp.]
MSFQTPLTVCEIINDIHSKKYLLPSVQREFVWKPEQIKKLFDNLMRDYPINSFLFWKVPKEKLPNLNFTNSYVITMRRITVITRRQILMAAMMLWQFLTDSSV